MKTPGSTHLFRKLWPNSLGAAHYIFAAVFLMRLCLLARLSSSPLLFPNGSDMQFYDDWAKQILQGHWSDHQAFYGLPLYSFLLAVLYRIFGYSPFVPGFFQACLDAGTAVLVFKLTLRLILGHDSLKLRGPAPESTTAATMAAILASAAWCFFVPAQAYSAILMPTAGSVFVFWFVVWQMVRNENVPLRRHYFYYGLLLGFTAMGVATVLFLAPLILIAILVRQSRFTSRSVAGSLLLGGIVVGTAPCWFHNYFIAKEPVFLSAHGGINLWLGNNPEATGYPRFPGLHAGQGQMLRDSIDQAESGAGRVLKRYEVSRYWSTKARQYISAHPAAWLRLLARKAGNFWNAFEYDDVGVIANLRSRDVLYPGLHFGLVAALGLAGAVAGWRRSPGSRWIVAAISVQLLAVLPVFVTERYRLSVVPGLLILGAVGLHRLWLDCATGSYRNVGLQLSVVAASALFVTLPRPDPSLWALEAYNSGRLALETNDLASAEENLRRAHALVPDNSEINLALGNLRLAQGNRADARAFYEAALRLAPNHKSALNNLGVMALEDNRPAQAKEYFRKVIEHEPLNAKAHFLLAKAELALGNTDSARTALAVALEREPHRAEYRELQDEIEQRARQ